MATKTATKKVTRSKSEKPATHKGEGKKVVKMRSFSDPNKTVDELNLKDPKALAAAGAKGAGDKPKKGKNSTPAVIENEALKDYKPVTFDQASREFTEHFQTLPGGVGLKVKNKNVTIDQFAHGLTFLMGLGQSIQFMIGDLLIASEQKFGEAASQICLATGYNYKTLANAQWVCEQIPVDQRRPQLPFSHHKAVAALTDKQREKLLDQAEKNRMTSTELEKKVKELKKGKTGSQDNAEGSTDGGNDAGATGGGSENQTGSQDATGAPAGDAETGSGEKNRETDELRTANDRALEQADEVISFLKSESFKQLRPLQRKAWSTIADQIAKLVKE